MLKTMKNAVKTNENKLIENITHILCKIFGKLTWAFYHSSGTQCICIIASILRQPKQQATEYSKLSKTMY